MIICLLLRSKLRLKFLKRFSEIFWAPFNAINNPARFSSDILYFCQHFRLALRLLVPQGLSHLYANTFPPFLDFLKIIICTAVQLMK